MMIPPICDERDPATQVFVCPLCCDLILKAPTITPCQHLFCRTCIESALARQPECPIDRRRLRVSQLSDVSGPLKQIWQATKVHCPKCTTWEGTLERYEAHITDCKDKLSDEQVKELQKTLENTKRENESLKSELMIAKEQLGTSKSENDLLRKQWEKAKRKIKGLLKAERDKEAASAMPATSGALQPKEDHKPASVPTNRRATEPTMNRATRGPFSEPITSPRRAAASGVPTTMPGSLISARLSTAAAPNAYIGEASPSPPLNNVAESTTRSAVVAESSTTEAATSTATRVASIRATEATTSSSTATPATLTSTPPSASATWTGTTQRATASSSSSTPMPSLHGRRIVRARRPILAAVPASTAS